MWMSFFMFKNGLTINTAKTKTHAGQSLFPKTQLAHIAPTSTQKSALYHNPTPNVLLRPSLNINGRPDPIIPPGSRTSL